MIYISYSKPLIPARYCAVASASVDIITTIPNQLAKINGIAKTLLCDNTLDLVVAPLTGNTDTTFAKHNQDHHNHNRS